MTIHYGWRRRKSVSCSEFYELLVEFRYDSSDAMVFRDCRLSESAYSHLPILGWLGSCLSFAVVQ